MTPRETAWPAAAGWRGGFDEEEEEEKGEQNAENEESRAAPPRAAIVVASSLSVSCSLPLLSLYPPTLTRFSARRDSARAAWRSMLKKKRVKKEREEEKGSKHFLLLFFPFRRKSEIASLFFLAQTVSSHPPRCSSTRRRAACALEFLLGRREWLRLPHRRGELRNGGLLLSLRTLHCRHSIIGRGGGNSTSSTPRPRG